jgi:hypothetical protein
LRIDQTVDARLEEESASLLAGEQSGETDENCPVRRLERRSRDLAPEHRYFVAEHDDFDGQVRVFRQDKRTSWRTRQNAR